MSLILLLDVLGVVVGGALLGLGLLFLRRRHITRPGGTFDCSLRLRDGQLGQGWSLGIGRYTGDVLEWYRVFSYATRPKRVLGRRDLKIVERRAPQGAEVVALLSGAVIVRCTGSGGPVDLAMTPDTFTGFLSWLESAPPGMPAP